MNAGQSGKTVDCSSTVNAEPGYISRKHSVSNSSQSRRCSPTQKVALMPCGIANLHLYGKDQDSGL